MLAALATKGEVVRKCVVAAPRNAESKTWAEAMEALDIEFVAVPRAVGGSKDPNDIAIAMEATRLVSSDRVSTVAIAVTDADFLQLAQRLHAWGYKTIALLESNSQASLAEAFKRSGTEVVRFQSESAAASRPKMKAVLYSNGEGGIVPMDGTEPIDAYCDNRAIEERLIESDFLADAGAPIVPAIAKYYVANAVGPLTVWPAQLPRSQFSMEVLQNLRRKSPCKNPGDLVYLCPSSNGVATKPLIARYGSLMAAISLHAGGPFVCKDSTHLPEEVLRRLGYLDDTYNTDLGEAVDTFVAMSKNRRATRALGMDIPSYCSVYSKKAMLHAALASSKAEGTWQVAPKDSSIRGFLSAHGYISSQGCSMDEAWEGAKEYARKCSIPVCKTYNLLVRRIMTSQNDSPSRRP